MPSIFDDPGLLDAFRAGEDSALAAIYRHYAEAVGAHLAFLARATGVLELAQPSAVADLLQEAFARAFSASARSAYDERRPYGPYLNRIAKNCFIDLLRKQRRDLARELRDPASLDRGSCERDDDEFGHRLLAVVDAYVSALSDPLRDVYEQRFAIGLTQKAACDVLGITRRALRTAETHLKQGAREALCLAGVLAPSAGRKREALRRRKSLMASST
jgi:RNA polymerase sigma factor (sigma-70 family)